MVETQPEERLLQDTVSMLWERIADGVERKLIAPEASVNGTETFLCKLAPAASRASTASTPRAPGP